MDYNLSKLESIRIHYRSHEDSRTAIPVTSSQRRQIILTNIMTQFSSISDILIQTFDFDFGDDYSIHQPYRLETLQKLNLTNCNLSDYFMENVFSTLDLPNLKYLALPYNNLTSLRNSYFDSVKHLEMVNFSNNPITHIDYPGFLHDLTKLRTIVMQNNPGQFIDGTPEISTADIDESNEVFLSLFSHPSIEYFSLIGLFGDNEELLQKIIAFRRMSKDLPNCNYHIILFENERISKFMIVPAY